MFKVSSGQEVRSSILGHRCLGSGGAGLRTVGVLIWYVPPSCPGNALGRVDECMCSAAVCGEGPHGG